jgi:hypothetical protein
MRHLLSKFFRHCCQFINTGPIFSKLSIVLGSDSQGLNKLSIVMRRTEHVVTFVDVTAIA